MRPPTITMTPTRKAANVTPEVSRVALVRACVLAPASEPAIASASTIGANRPISIVIASVTSYQGVLAASPAAGLAANTPWYDVTLAITMLIGRFAPIVLALAIAGSL